MTDTVESAATAEQLARVAALRTRRDRSGQSSGRPTGPARRSPAASSAGGRATGGRIMAAGLGAGATLGLVALFGMNDGSAATVADSGPAASTQSVAGPGLAAPLPVPPPIRVVIHRTATTAPPAISATGPAAVGSTKAGGPTTSPLEAVTAPQPPTTPAPVDLTATPIVETITVAAPQPPAAAPSAPAAPKATTRSSGS